MSAPAPRHRRRPTTNQTDNVSQHSPASVPAKATAITTGCRRVVWRQGGYRRAESATQSVYCRLSCPSPCSPPLSPHPVVFRSGSESGAAEDACSGGRGGSDSVERVGPLDVGCLLRRTQGAERLSKHQHLLKPCLGGVEP